MLFECDVLTDSRKILWDDILKESLSHIFAKELEDMDSWDRATFLISGLYNTYVVEWDSLFSAIVLFIHTMYNKKCHHIDS